MASGESVLDTLESHGIKLELGESSFKVHGGRLSGDLLALVRDNKEAVKEALRERGKGSVHCVTEVVKEEVAIVPLAVSPPPSADQLARSDVSSEWTTDQLWDVYRAIGDGAVLELSRQVPRVPKVHLESARAHVEALGALGPAAVMAACVALYKEQEEALRASGTDTFVLRASLALAASYKDNTIKFSPAYQELLRKSDEIKAKREVELGIDKDIDKEEVA